MNIHKHRSPQQVRTIIQALIDEMERHDIERIQLADLRRIVERCDEEMKR